MRILIVDDERPARDKLRRMLAQDPHITAIEEARDGVEALEKNASFAPDAIFLDVQMPEVSGLEVAASLPDPAPLIVFATAFDEYAVQAFDANAIDYLLKPFDSARLQRALQRLRARLCTRRAAPPQPGLPLQQLLVTDRGITQVVRVDDIQWLETADNYVILHTQDSAPLLRRPMSDLLAALGPAFARCHRRAAVQLAQVAHLSQSDVVLHNGTAVPLGRQYKQALLEALSAS